MTEDTELASVSRAWTGWLLPSSVPNRRTFKFIPISTATVIDFGACAKGAQEIVLKFALRRDVQIWPEVSNGSQIHENGMGSK